MCRGYGRNKRVQLKTKYVPYLTNGEEDIYVEGVDLSHTPILSVAQTNEGSQS